ncbi:yihD [Klebsiella pneumoniae]|nr:yihD [Klebsiella pneumoniae]
MLPRRVAREGDHLAPVILYQCRPSAWPCRPPARRRLSPRFAYEYRLFHCGIDPVNLSLSRVRSMTMKCKRLNEVIELLQPAWQKEPELNLMQFLQKLAKEAGYDGELSDLSDDILIYHLKMRDSSKDAVIPGIQKDYEEDFKTALLRARGVIKE